MRRKLVAEFVGAFALVFLAVGTAVVGIKTHGTGFVARPSGWSSSAACTRSDRCPAAPSTQW